MQSGDKERESGLDRFEYKLFERPCFDMLVYEEHVLEVELMVLVESECSYDSGEVILSECS